MFFIHVHTDASDNVGGDPVQIAVSDFDRRACLKGDLWLMRSLVEGEGLDWDDVTRIEAEVSADPDEVDPEVRACYSRKK